MAWNAAARGSAHHQMKLCKDEQSDQLASVLITPGLPSVSQDMAPLSRKRLHQTLVYQKGDFVAEDDDICDELLTNATEKKRRLTIEQVKYLEMSFSMDLKLEPERKALIAKHLGLRPRQVAIWFQNRRARWKNKQLEQDYEALKAKYEAAVRENENTAQRMEAIVEENKRLRAEVSHLTGIIRERDVPGIANVRGGDDEPARSSPDSDADSDSGSKEEQLSAKSELASPTKSDDQSEMQDSGHSYRMSEEAIVAVVDRPTGEISSVLACTAIKYEAEEGPFSPSEAVHVNPSLLIQQYVNGFHVEDLFYSWEDHAYGFAWGA